MLVYPARLLVVLLAQATCIPAFSFPSLFPKPKVEGDGISKLPPSQDPFYIVPNDISSYPCGYIIRSRKLPSNTKMFGPNAGDAYQLLFRTNGVHMKPDASVTTVIAPTKPAEGPVKIVAIAAPEDSPAIDCATSWAVYPDSASKSDVGNIRISMIPAMSALYMGYYVTLPDQEGSQAGYLAYLEGQVLLDSIRAIANHKLTIPDSTGYRVALTGYSGGGHTSAWAGQLASTYGKGLPIIALATGGIPVDLEAALTFLDGTRASGLVFAGLAGIGNVYPKYNRYLASILKMNGTEAFVAVRDGTKCFGQVVFSLMHKSFFGSVTNKDFLSTRISQEILAENFLGKFQKPITDFPVYQTHSQKDDTVIYGPAYSYYQSQCSQGAKILLSNPTSGDHGSTGTKSLPSFFYFIKQAFEDTLNLSECREMTDFLIPFNGPEAIATVGHAVVDAQNIGYVQGLVANALTS